MVDLEIGIELCCVRCSNWVFRQQCDDVRVVQRQRMEQQVSLELAAQMRSKGEQRQQQQQEERVFAELWEADRQAKEEREAQRVQRQQERNMEQLTVIKSQMEAAEQQRQDLKRLKEEEAGLMVRQIIQIIQKVST